MIKAIVLNPPRNKTRLTKAELAALAGDTNYLENPKKKGKAMFALNARRKTRKTRSRRRTRKNPFVKSHTVRKHRVRRHWRKPVRARRHARTSMYPAMNPPRRRRRSSRRRSYRRNPAPMMLNRRRARRGGRRYVRRGRRYHRNFGLSANPMMSNIKKLFNMNTLKDGAFVALGAISPKLISDLIVGKLLKKPELLTGPMGSPIRLIAGGIAAGLYTMAFKSPARGSQILIGAVSAEIVKMYEQYAAPKVRSMIGLSGSDGLLGATESEIKRAIMAEAQRQMDGYGDNMLGAFVSPGQAYDAPMLGGMGDYVTDESMDEAELLDGAEYDSL